MAIDTRVAEQFGRAVAEGDFAAAHALLTDEAQRSHSPEALKRAFVNMTAYADGPILSAEVMSDFVLADWPAKQLSDIAWVYVALAGESFSEAASLVLTETNSGVRIRQVEWGRP
jgi:hypothetical protein